MIMLIDTREAGPFTVRTYALPEDISPRGSFDDCLIDEVMAGIKSGRLEWFCAKVTAEGEGLELAADYLGGCCYGTFEEFANGQDYHGDMIRQAVAEAGARLRELSDKALECLEVEA